MHIVRSTYLKRIRTTLYTFTCSYLHLAPHNAPAIRLFLAAPSLLTTVIMNVTPLPAPPPSGAQRGRLHRRAVPGPAGLVRLLQRQGGQGDRGDRVRPAEEQGRARDRVGVWWMWWEREGERDSKQQGLLGAPGLQGYLP